MSETREQELVRKIQDLVRRNHASNYQLAFDHYSRKRGEPGTITGDELGELLKDADIGNSFTRGAWVSGIMEKVDANKDGRIQFREFEACVNGGAKGTGAGVR